MATIKTELVYSSSGSLLVGAGVAVGAVAVLAVTVMTVAVVGASVGEADDVSEESGEADGASEEVGAGDGTGSVDPRLVTIVAPPTVGFAVGVTSPVVPARWTCRRRH